MFNVLTMPLKFKLPAMIVGFCLTITAVLQVTIYMEVHRTALSDKAAQLALVAEQRSDALQMWFDRVEQDIRLVGASPATADAIERLSTAFNGIDGDPRAILQKAYLDDNPHPPGERQKLVEVAGELSFFRQHAVFHPFFDDVRQQRGFYDVFLFDLAGNAIYTTVKEPDFAANFATGSLAETGLGQVYLAALDGTPGEVHMSDFEPYSPSNDVPAGFAATPVANTNGRLIGVVAVQLPLDGLGTIMQDPEGLGETGEAYLVGSDLRARSASRFEGRFDVLDPLDGLLHHEDLGSKVEMLHQEVTLQSGANGFAQTRQVKTPSGDWLLVVDREMSEVMASSNHALRLMLNIGAVGAITVLAAGILMARAVTRPIARVNSAVLRVADGDLTSDVPETERSDELGVIARSLDGLREKLAASALTERERERLQAEQALVVEALSLALQSLAAGDLSKPITDPFADDYDMLRRDYNQTVETLGGTIAQMVDASSNIRARSTEISRASEDLSNRTENQAATLEQTAAALDQLTASVKSAADGARQVESIVQQARAEAEQSAAVVQGAVAAMIEIRKSSDHISQIIGVIDDIAFQTNLLALNAGVEAARAGDAGRGFAVVASEVRALAQRSSTAAKEIKTLIGASTQHVGRGVEQVDRTGEALSTIVNRVAHILTLVSDIAAGAGEQSTGLAEINIGVTQLDQVTQQNAAMVEEATAASHDLHNEASRLADLVEHFVIADTPSRRIPANLTHTAGRTLSGDRVQPIRSSGMQEVATPQRPQPAAGPPKVRSVPSGSGVWQEF